MRNNPQERPAQASVLDFGNNSITEEGAAALAKLLEAKPGLKVLRRTVLHCTACACWWRRYR